MNSLLCFRSQFFIALNFRAKFSSKNCKQTFYGDISRKMIKLRVFRTPCNKLFTQQIHEKLEF